MPAMGFSWGAFAVYVLMLSMLVLGGLWGLFASHHPAFLAPILMGLFYFYLCWEAVVEPSGTPPRAPGQKR